MKPLPTRRGAPSRPGRTLTLALAGAALAALTLLAAPPAGADVLRLENGRTMHGTVDRGFVDEGALRIQLFSTGGTVRVLWVHLIEDDRERWQVDLGLKDSAEAKELKIDASKITLVNAQILEGLILNPESMESGANAEIRVQCKGKELKYPRGLIAAVVPARLDLGLVYTPEQAYEIKKAEIGPNNGKAWYDLAEYARNVGDYDHAKECYLRAKEDPIFKDQPEGRQVESKLATLEVLLRNQGLQKEIDAVRQNLREARAQKDFVRAAKSFLEARLAVWRINQTVKDPVIQKEFRLYDLQMLVEKDRRKFFQERLPLEAYQRARRMMYEKAKEQKARDFPPGLDPVKKAIMLAQGTFEGARQYASRQIAADLWDGIQKDVGASEAIAAAAGPEDPQGTAAPRKEPTPEMALRIEGLTMMEKTLKEELRDYWKNRVRSSFNVTSYGYGSFIVVPNTLKLTRKPATQGGGGGNRGGNRPPQGQQQAVDVIKTADQWWEGAGTKERQDWLLSWSAERVTPGALFEKLRFWDENCDSCGGLGYKKTSVAATGEEEAERCSMCNGAKVVRKVKWQ